MLQTLLTPSRQGCQLTRAGHGYYTYEVESYKVFMHEVAPLFVHSYSFGETGKTVQQQFVWRGARNPRWILHSSLSRQLEKMALRGLDWRKRASDLTTQHLINFLSHLRGLELLKPNHDALHHMLEAEARKGYLSFLTVLNKMTLAQQYLTYEVFSLGQHHGLATPFLDWTRVPMIGLYFAFEQSDNRADGEGYRVVYALNRTVIQEECPPHEAHEHDSVLFLNSMAQDNPRIIGQAGLFTFTPAHLPVDEWVVGRFRHAEVRPVLIRFLIRNNGRSRCLADLDSLNINPRTIFPDRHGAAWHANYWLEQHIKLSSD